MISRCSRICSSVCRRSVNFDASRIFITGHSSGGGFAHELGCRYGNRIRAIAPVAGSLTTTTCIGAVAVLQIQGQYDPLVPSSVAQLAHRFWTLYNGFVSAPAIRASCRNASIMRRVLQTTRCSGACIRKVRASASGTPGTAMPGRALPMWRSGIFSVGCPIGRRRMSHRPVVVTIGRWASNDTTLRFTLRYPAGIPTPVTGGGSVVSGRYATADRRGAAGFSQSEFRRQTRWRGMNAATT